MGPDEPDALLSEARELTQVDRLLVGEALSDDAVLPGVGAVTAIGLPAPTGDIGSFHPRGTWSRI